MNIIDKIRTIPGLESTGPCNIRQMSDALMTLGINRFPKEYIDYVKTFGAVSFDSTEICGLNTGKHNNVVDKTLFSLKNDSAFPKGFFVIQNLDEIQIIANSNDSVNCQIYEYQHGVMKFIVDSLNDYLDEPIARAVRNSSRNERRIPRI